MRILHFILLIFIGQQLHAEDAYQLLRSDPSGYAEVVPGKDFMFPRDHLPHKQFKIEWWYLTADLEDETGAHFGIHWTLFRQAMSADVDPEGWQSNQVWMAHTALSTPDDFLYEQRFARGGIGQAGVVHEQQQFSAWLDDWRWQSEGLEPFPGTLDFTTQQAAVKLSMRSDTPWVLQGDQGYSQKSELGQASYYYSQPHIRINGTITQDGSEIAVSGKGWLDREWSSQPLAPDQPGWDWLSIHLDDGYALMVYRLRQTGRDDWLSGSWVDPTGRSTSLKPGDIEFEPTSMTLIETPRGPKKVPLHWRVSLPDLGLSWVVSPRGKDHWLDTAFPYWEGPVEITGSSNGNGYLELTGY